MRKVLAVALCSGALVGAPAAFAQTASSTTHGGGSNELGTTNPPAPGHTDPSQGTVTTPPPLDRSGNPDHVNEKRPNTGNGSGTSGATGGAAGTGGQDGAGSGSSGSSGSAGPGARGSGSSGGGNGGSGAGSS